MVVAILNNNLSKNKRRNITNINIKLLLVISLEIEIKKAIRDVKMDIIS